MLNFTMFWFAPIYMVLQHFKGLSFPTISSVGPNAAVIHYSPDPKTCLELDADSIYLFDSGAQVDLQPCIVCHNLQSFIFKFYLYFLAFACNAIYTFIGQLIDTGPHVFEVSRWNNWYYTDCSFWQAFCACESMLYCCRWTLLLSFWFKNPCSFSCVTMCAFTLTFVFVDLKLRLAEFSWNILPYFFYAHF